MSFIGYGELPKKLLYKMRPKGPCLVAFTLHLSCAQQISHHAKILHTKMIKQKITELTFFPFGKISFVFLFLKARILQL